MLESAKKAVTLDDLEELYELAVVITLCRDYRVISIEGLDAKIERLRKIAESTHGSLHNVRLREMESLAKARDFMADHKLLPQKSPSRCKAAEEARALSAGTDLSASA